MQVAVVAEDQVEVAVAVEVVVVVVSKPAHRSSQSSS